jgi:flavin reductase (DIM6/NTAB) family NADH-FMN oxidoreductase RutF
MRRFATGVTVVTTIVDGRPHGFTANAFSSVSADPPLLLLCVNRSAFSHSLISQAGFFCVNVLSLEQRSTAERFASRDVRNRFEGISWSAGVTGAPIVNGTLSHFDCTLSEEHTAGTHTVFLGSVVGCGTDNGAPLGYFDGAYRDFGCRPALVAS